MPNVKSILNDIEKLPLHQREQILSTLEELCGSKQCNPFIYQSKRFEE